MSHCWGSKARFVLNSANLLERQYGLAIEALPPTFRDAIEVTRRLGYQYLWIDSLCILQDSYKDWEMESALMQEYYQNSLFTIALDTTPGDHCGFLNQIREMNSSVIAIPFQSTEVNEAPSESDKASLPVEQIFLRYRTGKKYAAHLTLDDFPLLKRGWTLQEDILAVRTVHYSKTHLSWECQQHRKLESMHGAIGMRISKPLKHLFLCGSLNNVTGGSWYRIVESYLQRELTFPEDLFPAISGIAREVSRPTGFTYKAGIWLEDFHVVYYGLSAGRQTGGIATLLQLGAGDQ